MYISSAYTTRKTDNKHTAAPDVKDILSEDIDFYLLFPTTRAIQLQSVFLFRFLGWVWKSDIVEFLTPE